MRVQVTYQIAMAAGKDAATRAMRAAGRTTWNAADYSLCVATVDRLLPHQPSAP